MLAHFGISDEKWTPGTAVGMLPNGPPMGRPGFGSQVSNWLGAPQSQSRMTFFSAFFAAAAKSGLVNRPVKLVHRRRRRRRPEPFEEQPAVEPVFARGAAAGSSAKWLADSPSVIGRSNDSSKTPAR